STIDPSTARRIWLKAKEKEAGAVDAPVSGGTVGAEMGTLTIMVGGEKETVDACMDVLRAIGKNIYYVGGPGSGQIFKLLNNMLVGINLAAVGEALVLASKAGVDLKLLYEVIKTSAGNSWAFENKAPNMFEDRFEPGFRVWLQHKDLGLALNMASEQSIPTPLLAFTYAMFESAKALGLENMDHSSIVKVFEAMSNTKVSRYKP
ncbi:MAG: NAD(P)-dependent oxidoreductase, partial [Candidatus Bathyarchaeia archaeon]